MHNNTTIETAPTRQDIDEVLIWLKSERDRDARHYGFYNNKDIIISSFERGDSIVFKNRGKNIGIVTWHEDNEIKLDIDIFVIHPDYRGQGYGSYYYDAITDFYRNEGFKAVKLFCEPKTSESFWKKMGLIEYPDCGYTEHKLTYYGILVKTASTTYITKADKIELWDVEHDREDEKAPKWTWYVEIQDGKLIYPIIQPCNCDWNLRWSRNGTVLKNEKVKYFTDVAYELLSSQFLYIDELRL